MVHKNSRLKSYGAYNIFSEAHIMPFEGKKDFGPTPCGVRDPTLQSCPMKSALSGKKSAPPVEKKKRKRKNSELIKQGASHQWQTNCWHNTARKAKRSVHRRTPEPSQGPCQSVCSPIPRNAAISGKKKRNSGIQKSKSDSDAQKSFRGPVGLACNGNRTDRAQLRPPSVGGPSALKGEADGTPIW